MAKGKYQEWLQPEGLLKIEGWARDGLVEEQIAANMGIGYSTLQSWKTKYQDIQDTLKKGKEIIDRKVENALLKRALGYSYTENKYISVPMEQVEYSDKLHEYMNRYRLNHPDATDDELMLVQEQFPKTKEILAERKTKEVVPDTTAQIFWLKNRKPHEWRDKQDIEHSGGISINNPFEGLTTEELKKLIHDG
ncbi:hypothetical protein [Robinsoniella sp. KNHs210]|uniref:hypothetical protein n=1 Tax=Robinsoniella sp. KNHs210 TaxID=1469950 RepID=UPI000481F141|nr:hypothetical protein [Robinsoniella sp. KNHs210]